MNVALNSPMYTTAMCGKLLYVRATGEDDGCTTCGMNPIPDQYMLARVTNECPECLHGSLDFGIQGDGRCIPLCTSYQLERVLTALLLAKVAV